MSKHMFALRGGGGGGGGGVHKLTCTQISDDVMPCKIV